MKIPRFLYRLQAYLWNYIPLLAHTLGALLIAVAAQAFGIANIAFDPFILVVALFIGNLPDIDTSFSHIGRLVPFISKRIEQRFGHRTITHSVWPIVLLGLVGWFTRPWFAPWPWWLWPAMYASHIVLDMVIGLTGVPLFWPHPARFYYLRKIKSGAYGERLIALLLFVAVFLLVWYGAPNPGDWIARASGGLDYAVFQYRELEPTHEVIAAIEATDNVTHESIVGSYRVIALKGKTFTLDIDGRHHTAGQGDQDLYIRTIRIQAGAQRRSYLVPTFTPTPVIIPVRINHVTDLETEILVAVNDVVEEGQLIALRQPPIDQDILILVPTSTPVLTTTPRPTSSLDPLTMVQAGAEVEHARALATRAFAPPAPAVIESCISQLEGLRNRLWQDQLERDALKIRANEGGISYEQIRAKEAGLFDQERRIAEQQQTCDGLANSPHAADAYARQVAAAALAQAEVRYLQHMATPTPRPTSTPTRTPTPTATTSPEEAEVRSLVSGLVVDVEIVAVNGNEATVEIRIAMAAEETQAMTQTQPEAFAPLPPPAGELAYVIRVSDGDTLDVRFSDGSDERLRLLDVDTPETVHPNKPVQCYGPEASAYTKQVLCGTDSGKNCVGIGVYVEEAGREKYGRLLAYVWTQEGTLFNEELAARGLAQYNDYGQRRQYSTRVSAAAQQARAAGVGMWGACPME